MKPPLLHLSLLGTPALAVDYLLASQPSGNKKSPPPKAQAFTAWR